MEGRSGPEYKAGFLERTVTRILMRPAKVTATSDLSENFRLIDFQGEALRECSWTPGDKLQIKLDRGLSSRTYTPIEWEKTTGHSRILAYCHGTGPGSDWARRTETGDERQLFGPRGSLRLDGLSARTVLVGDETSVGLAIALHRCGAAASTCSFVLEANDRTEIEGVLVTFGLSDATVVQRQPQDTHVGAVLEAVLPSAGPETTFILSGKAGTIQHVSRALKAKGVESRHMRTKAYWAPGKIGLD